MDSDLSHLRYIVVEGPIGVGKTTLAARLAHSLGCELLLEGVDDNPFLERFYRDPRQGALPTQLFFLFQRARQMQQIRQGDIFSPVKVADFLMEKDRLFAQITLDDLEYQLYEQAYAHLTLDVPSPDLVIYLQAPVDVLLARISQRARRIERGVTAEYLARLSEAYTQYFYHFDKSPLLIVNAAEIDFAHNDEDYRQLLNRIQSVRSGRHYFNPLAIGL